MTDAVVIGSAITVLGAVIVLGFLSFKVMQLMKKDEENRKK